MRLALVKILFLVTFSVLNSQSWASERGELVDAGLDDKGAYLDLCVVRNGNRVLQKEDGKVSMRLSVEVEDEPGYAKQRWLVARLTIEKGEQTPDSFRLSKMAFLLPYVSSENFRSQCGNEIVYGNLMGDQVEVSWILSEDSGVEKSETLFEQSFASDQVTRPAIEDFARLVDSKLATFAGQSFQRRTAVQPVNLLNGSSCRGVRECFSLGLNNSNTISPGPIKNLIRPLTDEMIRSLQSGSELPVL